MLQPQKLYFSITTFLLGLCLFVSTASANDNVRFNRDVQLLTGDWTAEPWHFGWLRLHQRDSNEVADEFFLHLWEEERPKNATAQQILERSFANSKIGDVDNERVVSMTGASIIGGNILVKSEGWNSQFGKYLTFWGVITTAKGGFISFKSQCNFRPYKTVTYSGDQCVATVSKLLSGIQNGTLIMPRSTAPIALPKWSGRIDENGNVRLFYTGWFGGYGPNLSVARSAHIYVSPAKAIASVNERTEIMDFANATEIKGFGPASAANWNENVMSRAQPEAGEGPAIQLAMAVKIPDGRKSLVSMSCWNKEWQQLCMSALERVLGDLESGFVEEKWRAFK